jgi:fibro-slime domain-containing protein
MSLRARSINVFFAGVALALSSGCGSDEGDGVNIGDGTSPISPGQLPGGGGSSVVVIPNPGSSGATGSGGATNCNPVAVGRLRDFKAEHPDFEGAINGEKGIVLEDLGLPDRKPVYSGSATLQTTHTQADFDQWYRDVDGVNMAYDHAIAFTTGQNGRAIYDNSNFFPLDMRGFGNEGNNHNFHFTFELHMTFKYSGGEVFTFRGDDDVFVFVNNKLAIDLGGVHGAQEETINLDEAAARLGITVGGDYPIDFFQAERHTSQSNFRIETTLAFTNCSPIIIP